MKENDLLAFIAAHTPPHAGVPLSVGDDMAVVRAGAWEGTGQERGDAGVLLKIDQCVDGLHFDLRQHTAAQAGRKAVNRCLSDCAAMACRPAAILLAVVLPASATEAQAQELFLACRDAAAAFDCPLVGGDTAIWPRWDAGEADEVTGETTASGSGLVITVAALGAPVPGINPVRRSGAQAGDAIMVTGRLGGSILGRHLTFTPRIELAIELARLVPIHAMMDLSDGLAQDLPRLCRASGGPAGLGAIVAPAHLPIHADAEKLAQRDGLPAALHALADGEDYELLFTIAEADLPMLFPSPTRPSVLSAKQASVGVTRIGTMTAEPVLQLMDEKDQLHPWPKMGWQHHT